MKRLLIILILLPLIGFGAMSQERESAGFGLDPSDSSAVSFMRERMDSIRRYRPTVALVLSGGGAKGAATLGVMRYMEQKGIPLDLIVGTSVGGLLGGLYSLGYTPLQLDSLLRTMDWEAILYDRIDGRYIPYRRQHYKQTYAVSIPFYYKEDGFTASDLARLGTDATRMIGKKLVRSLPSGYTYGTKFNHLISSKTVGYSDSTDFFKFPIPFACVATDLVSAKAKVWHNGSIGTAMRSTMSIPLLFTPVHAGDMVLTDGGMRNNFPVDIARDLGADIIIGVDLSSEDGGGVNNVLDIVMRSIDLMSQDSYERSINEVDLYLHPDITGYNLLSFFPDDMAVMEARGYLEAEKHAAGFDSLALITSSRGAVPPAAVKRATDITQTNVVIDTVIIKGLKQQEAEIISSRIGFHKGSIVNYDLIEDRIDRIYGEGIYEYVNYELQGEKEPYRLVVECKKGPVHRLGLGVRADTEDLVSLLLNLGLNTNSVSGSSLDMVGKLSANPYATMHYSLSRPGHATFNAKAGIRWTDRNNFISGSNFYNISFLKSFAELSVSNINLIGVELNLGADVQYWHVHKVMGTGSIGNVDLSAVRGLYPGAFLEISRETLDDCYFPTKGISYSVKSEIKERFESGKMPVFGIASARFTMPLSIGSFTLIPQANVRYVIGTDLPLVYANALGGDYSGRYVDHQIAFIGIDNAAFKRNCLMVGRMDARLKLGSVHYLFAGGNVAIDFDDYKNILKEDFVWGVGAGYALNTPFGPIKAQIHYSSLTGKVHPYVAVGFNF